MTHKLCNDCLIPFDTFILFMRRPKGANEGRARENKLKIEDFDLGSSILQLVEIYSCDTADL